METSVSAPSQKAPKDPASGQQPGLTGVSGRGQGPGAAAPEGTQLTVHLGPLTAPECCGEGCLAGVEARESTENWANGK